MSRSVDLMDCRYEQFVSMPLFSEGGGYSFLPPTTVRQIHSAKGFNWMHVLLVHAVGFARENDDYVSLLFHLNSRNYEPHEVEFEFSFVISVLDATGEKRFPTSYVFSEEPLGLRTSEKMFSLPFIGRETLLAETDDLLPDDSLTLHIDVTIRKWYDPIVYDLLQRCKYLKSGRLHLHFDSELGKHLIEASPYFKKKSEHPLHEERGYVSIIKKDLIYFQKACLILEGVKNLVVSVEDLRRIYITANEYFLRVVMESCRSLLSTLLRVAGIDPVIKEHIAKKVREFFELAYTWQDDRLKRIVETYLKRNREDASKISGTPESTLDHSETEWRLRGGGGGCGYFEFVGGTREKEKFDFYR